MTHLYTGPTDLTYHDGKLHIEGYPDARRVVKLATPAAKRLAALRLHQVDLGLCEKLMQFLCNIDQADLSEALWTAILTKFFSCFGDSKARAALHPTKVYKGIPDALTAFRFFENIRNKHVVHDENNYRLSTTAVVLGDNSEVQDILSFAVDSFYRNEETSQTLYNLIDRTRKFVESEIASTLKKIFTEVNTMTPSEREQLPELSYRVPVSGDEGKTRKY